jgi:hypothetical protein
MARKTTPIIIRSAKSPAKPKETTIPPAHEHKAEEHHHAPEHHAPKKDNTMDSLRNIIRKYFAMLPLVRGKEIAEVVVDPDAAIQNEIKTTGIKVGFIDNLFSAYLYMAAMVIFYLILILAAFAIGFAISLSQGQDILGGLGTMIALAGGSLIVLILILLAIFLIVTPIVIFLALLLETVYFFIFSRLLGGKGSFSKTFGLLGTFGTLHYISSAIAILLYFTCIGICFAFPLSMVVSIYWAYLIYKMNIHLHGLSSKNAIIATALPCIIGLILFAGSYLALVLLSMATS